MLTTISWAEYTAGAAILLTAYYVFVGLKYFSPDLSNLVSGKRKPYLQEANSRANEEPFDGSTDSIAVNNGTPDYEPDPFAVDEDMDEVEALIGRLTQFIGETSQSNALATDFKEGLRHILNEYPDIKNSPLRPSVNELIVSECEKYGAVTLSEADVDGLWENDR